MPTQSVDVCEPSGGIRWAFQGAGQGKQLQLILDRFDQGLAQRFVACKYIGPSLLGR